MTQAEREDLIYRASLDPIDFGQDICGYELWDKQIEIIRALEVHDWVTVRACHASSKTFTAALIAAHWPLHREEGQVVIIAPTLEKHIKVIQFAQLGKIISRARRLMPKLPEPQSYAWWLKKPERGVLGVATKVEKEDEGVNLQGFHGDQMLFIIDEAPGIDKALYAALEGIRSGGNVKILELGNPTTTTCQFYLNHTKHRRGKKVIRISAWDTPNLHGLTIKDLKAWREEDDPRLYENAAPYLTKRSWVLEKYEQWGPRSSNYQSRVDGEFPENAKDALFSAKAIEDASAPYEPHPHIPLVIGIDAAGDGGDETVAYALQRGGIVDWQAWDDPDPRGELVGFVRRLHGKYGVEQVNIDAIGVGWGLGLHLTSELADLPLTVNLVKWGCNPLPEGDEAGNNFRDLKAQMHWRLRGLFDADYIRGLEDEETQAQLLQLKMLVNTRSEMHVIEKKKLDKSPDRAEALVYAAFRFAAPAPHEVWQNDHSMSEIARPVA